MEAMQRRTRAWIGAVVGAALVSGAVTWVVRDTTSDAPASKPAGYADYDTLRSALMAVNAAEGAQVSQENADAACRDLHASEEAGNVRTFTLKPSGTDVTSLFKIYCG